MDSQVALLIAVHPHRRGEHLCFAPQYRCAYGSSPQAWGTFKHRSLKSVPVRFIPTGVGNIHTHCFKSSFETVHPHRRGEHRSIPCTIRFKLGSSPQAWGTSYLKKGENVKRRFIPTGVGNIRAILVDASSNAVHPHRRGEHTCSIPPLFCPKKGPGFLTDS